MILVAPVKGDLFGPLLWQVTRDTTLREWTLDETAENMHRNFGSGYPGGKLYTLSVNQNSTLF